MIRFVHLTKIDQEWSGAPYTQMVSVNADQFRWMVEQKQPWEIANAPASVTHIQLSGEGMRNDQWLKVTESIAEVEKILAEATK